VRFKAAASKNKIAHRLEDQLRFSDLRRMFCKMNFSGAGRFEFMNSSGAVSGRVHPAKLSALSTTDLTAA
jgi:hypothetical protein